jgi:hypothetical protein
MDSKADRGRMAFAWSHEEQMEKVRQKNFPSSGFQVLRNKKPCIA